MKPIALPRRHFRKVMGFASLYPSYKLLRGDVVRIISARGAEPHEKRKYHEI